MVDRGCATQVLLVEEVRHLGVVLREVRNYLRTNPDPDERCDTSNEQPIPFF